MKYMIAVPCMDTIPTTFVMSLFTMINHSAAARLGQLELRMVQGSLIYDARDKIAADAIAGGFDRVMWLDSDMKVDPEIMVKMAEYMDAGMEYITGLYFARKAPYGPVLYKDLRLERDGNLQTPFADMYKNFPERSVFEIAGSGFGGVMTSVKLLDQVTQNFGLPFFPFAGFGEDLAFCWRVKQLGIPMYCDSSIEMTHVGLFDINKDIVRALYLAQEDKHGQT